MCLATQSYWSMHRPLIERPSSLGWPCKLLSPRDLKVENTHFGCLGLKGWLAWRLDWPNMVNYHREGKGLIMFKLEQLKVMCKVRNIMNKIFSEALNDG
ncbi:hypothetical protein ACSBR2_025009 [Camellia fascicularis]